MQNDPLYNRIMEQMPDTEAIEGEITTLAGKVTALEGKQAKIFTFHITIDPDNDNALSCADFSLLTPSQFIELNPDIITIRVDLLPGLDNSPYEYWVNAPTTYPNINLGTNEFFIDLNLEDYGFIIIHGAVDPSNSWEIYYD